MKTNVTTPKYLGFFKGFMVIVGRVSWVVLVPTLVHSYWYLSTNRRPSSGDISLGDRKNGSTTKRSRFLIHQKSEDHTHIFLVLPLNMPRRLIKTTKKWNIPLTFETQWSIKIYDSPQGWRACYPTTNETYSQVLCALKRKKTTRCCTYKWKKT